MGLASMTSIVGLPRKLGFLDSLSIVVGNVIGSAIFLGANSVAQSLPSGPLIVAAWVFAGAISLFGALAFAELGAMMPETGGQYVHMRETFGRFWAFLFGWALFLVIRSGGTAALAVGFSIYLGYFLPLEIWGRKLAAVAIVGLLTYVNYRGVVLSAGVQKAFTFLKVLGLGIVIVGVFASPVRQPVEWSSGPLSISNFGVALIACLWAYQGWFALSWVAGEVKGPERNLPLALGAGVGIVIAVYVMANLAYMKVLPVPEIAHTERVAAAAAERAMGSVGAAIVSLTILLSIISSLNSGFLSAPRVYFAQARDGLFFQSFGAVHPRYVTPYIAVLAQGVWSAVLAASGSYEKLFSYVIFTSWIFYAMTVAGVFVLRRKYPDLPRPYRVWGYPWAPALFVGMALAFLVNTLLTKPGPALMGLAIIATGVPAYWFWARRISRARTTTTRL